MSNQDYWLTGEYLFTLASVSYPLLANMRSGWPSVGILEDFLSEATARGVARIFANR